MCKFVLNAAVYMYAQTLGQLTFLRDSSTLVSALKLKRATASPISLTCAGGGGRIGCCFSVDGIFCVCVCVCVSIVSTGMLIKGMETFSMNLVTTRQMCTHMMQHKDWYQLCIYLYIRYGEYPHPSSVLPFVPVGVYLPDDVYCITLFKCQLPVTQSHHSSIFAYFFWSTAVKIKTRQDTDQQSSFHVNSISHRMSATKAEQRKIQHQLKSCTFI